MFFISICSKKFEQIRHWWAGKDSNLRTQMRTDFLLLQFSLPNKLFVVWTFSLSLKDTRYKVSTLGINSQLGIAISLPVKVSPNQPGYHHIITYMSCKFRFLKTKDHSLPPLATRPPTQIYKIKMVLPQGFEPWTHRL